MVLDDDDDDDDDDDGDTACTFVICLKNKNEKGVDK